MKLPNIRYQSKMPRLEQVRFGGIDRSEYASDGSVRDMCNISTLEYPILKTVDNRRQKGKVYDNPWYYGNADKEFVIAGNIKGKGYPEWKASTYYASGTIVAHLGELWKSKKEISASSEIAKAQPPCCIDGWSKYTGTSFQYHGEWKIATDYALGEIRSFGGEFFRHITTGRLAPHKDKEHWKKSSLSYKGEWHAKVDYFPGDIVYNANYSPHGFYEQISTGKISGQNPLEEKYWKKIEDIPTYDASKYYYVGDIVLYSGVLYEAVAEGYSCNPKVDTLNWEPYSYAELYYDGKRIDGLQLSPGKKECAYLNGYIVILPDNMYYNVYDGSYGYLKGNLTGSFTNSVYGGFYNSNDSKYYSYSFTHGAMLCNGEDIGSEGVMNAIRFGAWSTADTWSYTYFERTSLDLRDIFNKGDVVYVDDSVLSSDRICIREGTYAVLEVLRDALVFETNTFAGADVNEDMNNGTDSKPEYDIECVRFTKSMPEMDYLCVANNRMWGCKEDTVYGSELGNCFSWERYSGQEIDPVYLESGDIGEFTGCCEYGGYPTFFKENEMYRVYGSTASSFAISKVADYGIKKGCAHSVCTVDSILFFLSPKGVCAYTGGIPAIVSGKLRRVLSEGIAGTDGKRYFLSADDGDGRKLYVWDTECRVWTSEDLADVPLGVANVGEDLLYMSSEGVMTTLSKPYESYDIELKPKLATIEFADFYEESTASKDLGRIIIRASVAPEYDSLNIFVQYDSDGIWHKAGSIYNQDNRKKVTEFGFFPRRCDHYRIKLECEGKFTLYSVARQVK